MNRFKLLILGAMWIGLQIIGTTASAMSEFEDNGPVSTVPIDLKGTYLEVDYEKKLFNREKVEVAGTCPDQEDSVLIYQVYQGEVKISQGFIQCRSGKFVLNIDPRDEIECGKLYTVVVKRSDREVSRFTLKPNCES